MHYSIKLETLVYVSSFISSTCVQLFTAFELPVLLWWVAGKGMRPQVGENYVKDTKEELWWVP